jgi:hypothetical protein
MTNPVVQVAREPDGEVVYTLRIRGTAFRPRVFADGTYTIRVGEPARTDEGPARNPIDSGTRFRGPVRSA